MYSLILLATMLVHVSTSLTVSISVSKNRRCGADVAFTCQGSFWGNCCRRDGLCGSAAVFCGDGCQRGYGSCHGSSSSMSSSTTLASSSSSASVMISASTQSFIPTSSTTSTILSSSTASSSPSASVLAGVPKLSAPVLGGLCNRALNGQFANSSTHKSELAPWYEEFLNGVQIHQVLDGTGHNDDTFYEFGGKADSSVAILRQDNIQIQNGTIVTCSAWGLISTQTNILTATWTLYLDGVNCGQLVADGPKGWVKIAGTPMTVTGNTHTLRIVMTKADRAPALIRVDDVVLLPSNAACSS